MIYAILGISIIIIVIGALIENNCSYDMTGGVFLVIGSVFLIISAIALFVCLYCRNDIKCTTDNQIIVYEEQNEVIMAQIEPLVEKYLNYEKETYSSFKPDVNTLVAMSMYPELKGNEFVQSQIKIIVDNQQKITELRLDKAKLKAYKFWIFVGE